MRYVRKGKGGQTGDARFTLDKSSVSQYEISKGRSTDYVELSELDDETGIEMIRFQVRRNHYVPRCPEGIEALIFDPPTLRSVERADVQAEGASGAAIPASLGAEATLIASGDVEGLAEFLAATLDGVGPKLGRRIAEQKIAQAGGS